MLRQLIRYETWAARLRFWRSKAGTSHRLKFLWVRSAERPVELLFLQTVPDCERSRKSQLTPQLDLFRRPAYEDLKVACLCPPLLSVRVIVGERAAIKRHRYALCLACA